MSLLHRSKQMTVMARRQGQDEPFLTRPCTGQAKSRKPKWMTPQQQTTRSVLRLAFPHISKGLPATLLHHQFRRTYQVFDLRCFQKNCFRFRPSSGGISVTSGFMINAAAFTEHECIHLHVRVRHTVLRTAELISMLRKFTEVLPAASSACL